MPASSSNGDLPRVDPTFPHYRVEATFDGPLVSEGDEVEVRLYCDVGEVPSEDDLAHGEPIRLSVRDFAGPRRAPRGLEPAVLEYEPPRAAIEAGAHAASEAATDALARSVVLLPPSRELARATIAAAASHLFDGPALERAAQAAWEHVNALSWSDIGPAERQGVIETQRAAFAAALGGEEA